MRVTIADVARQAGCSLITVSRALNGRPDVSPATRSRVQAAARALGYFPNALARSLVTGATHTVGFVLTDPALPLFAVMIEAVETAATAVGYSVIICNSREDPAAEARALATLRSKQVDGVVIVPTQGDAQALADLRDAGMPIVLIHRNIPDLGLDFVGPDHVEGARTAVRHLVGVGCRRIAFISNNRETSTVHDREAGFHAALDEAGIGNGDALVARPALRQDAAYAATRDLVHRARPDGLFLFDDMMAPAALAAIRDEGLRIPEDVAVVAIGSSFFDPYLSPPLTSVQSPTEEVGRTAIDLLVRRMQGDRSDLPVVRRFSGSLEVRASTARRVGSGAR